MSDVLPPLMLTWNGDAFDPSSGYWRRMANEHLVVGARYRMVEEADRSTASHNHEFGWIKEAWNSLPDELLAQYPNSEVLRKHALIAKGYCTVVQHSCPTKAEAERLAAILKPRDVYAIVIQRGNVVSEYTAVSQSKRAMGNPQFQASKTAIMEFVGDLIGVDPETLGKVQQAA